MGTEWRLASVLVVGDWFESGLEFLLGGKIELVFRGEAIGVLRQGEFDEGVVLAELKVVGSGMERQYGGRTVAVRPDDGK